MSEANVPKVSVGIPVYNGEKYLADCLRCYLDQTWSDFEIVISDNGSADRTRAICEEFAARDPRVRYHRQAENQGAAWNFNEVLRLARAPFFKWAAYDDRVSPDFLAGCLRALEERPRDILSYGVTIIIDGEGKEKERKPDIMRITSPRPSERLREYFLKVRLTSALYGVIRTDILREAGGMGNFVSSDVVLLGDLALRGTFREAPDVLFYRRFHPGTYSSGLTSWAQRAVWFDPRQAGKLVLPTWTHCLEYLRSVRRVPMSSAERLRCLWVFLRWARYEVPGLLREAVMAVRVKLFGMPRDRG